MHYESVKARHRREYADKQQRLDRLTAEQGGRAIVLGRVRSFATISRVGFASGKIRHVYKTKRMILRARRLDDGRIMACTAPRGGVEMDFVFIDPMGQRPTTTIELRDFHESRAAPNTVLGMSERHVLCQVDYDAVRCDLGCDTYARVVTGNPARNEWPNGGFEAGGCIVVCFRAKENPYGKGEAVIVRASPPYEELARLPKAAAAQVGAHTLVLGEGTIGEYDPESSTMRHLVDGKFLCPAGHTGFVHCASGLGEHREARLPL
ncbi:MAG: hypothetical protein JW889_04795 [Verrucomicrobia bacterium]|nr:hypothetical protein [Verrucomicrobiota bacterium]